MTTASLELCKELYELSGWEDEDLLHWQERVGGDGTTMYDLMPHEPGLYPAYDSGYLLRKLPKLNDGLNASLGIVWNIKKNQWQADYGGGISVNIADTPEDALCKLAIELFKQRVLERS